MLSLSHAVTTSNFHCIKLSLHHMSLCDTVTVSPCFWVTLSPASHSQCMILSFRYAVTTSQRHCVICHCAMLSMCQTISVLDCKCATTSLCHAIHTVTESHCHCVTLSLSQTPCLRHSVTMVHCISLTLSPYHSGTVSHHHCVALSLCHNITGSQCHCFTLLLCHLWCCYCVMLSLYYTVTHPQEIMTLTLPSNSVTLWQIPLTSLWHLAAVTLDSVTVWCCDNMKQCHRRKLQLHFLLFY